MAREKKYYMCCKWKALRKLNCNILPLKFRNFLILFVCLAFFSAGESSGHSPLVSIEYKVKAAYLLNFTRYVEWPQEAFFGPDEPLVIGVLGMSAFVETLEKTIKGRKSHGRNLEIRRLKNPDDVKGLHVLFISRSQQKYLKRLLTKLQGKPVLTVGESKNFLEQGGGINLVLVEETVRFEVNLAVTERSGLKVSSRMLNLAKSVIRNNEKEKKG